MSRHQAEKITKAYAQALEKNRFKFENMYLFGSRAIGRENCESDIDIAVIAKRPWRGGAYLSQKMKLWTIAAEVDARIEPVLLAPTDLKKDTVSIIGDQVRRYGIRVR